MIETQDLSKQFHDFWAVDGLSLQVQPGQILALLGQNGAGKTTTVRMLTALLRPSRGWARVAGYDVVQQPRQVRSVVGVLTEQHGLYARMNAIEYLDFFGQIYSLPSPQRKKRIDDLLEYFDMTRDANRRIGEYSKGMRQKLALARALIHEPLVLLLDEPTSAMDPESARLVRDEIARLRSTKRTIVLCTHNLVEAETLADHIVIIYRGRALLQGSLEELKERVLGPAEYEAILSKPWEPTDLQLPEGVKLTQWSGPRLQFRVERPHQTNPHLIKALLERQAPLILFQESPRSLEQVYLKVMAQVQGKSYAN